MTISLGCRDCHFFEHDYNVLSYNLTCQYNTESGVAEWNNNIQPCKEMTCDIEELLDRNTVMEITEEQNDICPCQTIRTFKCKNEHEFFSFKFGLSEMNYQYTPGGWNVSSSEACNGLVSGQSSICNHTKRLECTFQVPLETTSFRIFG